MKGQYTQNLMSDLGGVHQSQIVSLYIVFSVLDWRVLSHSNPCCYLAKKWWIRRYDGCNVAILGMFFSSHDNTLVMSCYMMIIPVKRAR
jgi:hypothetical protein